MDSAVLVLSCDKYAHLWPAFFECWRRFFPECKYPVYLGSNSAPFAMAGVKTLFTGDDPDWSTSLTRILAQIPEKRIFLILEDLFLASPMNAAAFDEVFKFMQTTDANFVKYYRPARGDAPIEGAPFESYQRGRPHRISVVGFWNKTYLQSLLLPGENPWNFEILGSYRTSYSDGFYRMNKTLCEFSNMIEKGRWYPAGLKWAEQQGLDVGRSQRELLAGGLQLKSLLQIFVYRCVHLVGWRTRLRLMNFLRRLLASY